MKLEIEVTDCRGCPMRHSYRGHGECWEECTHKDSLPGKGGYATILWGCREEFTSIPEWCPLKGEKK